jgi:hypothetical protein
MALEFMLGRSSNPERRREKPLFSFTTCKFTNKLFSSFAAGHLHRLDKKSQHKNKM